MQILDYKVRLRHNKILHPVKVLWANHTASEVTWGMEEDVRNKYLYLFKVNRRFLSKFASFENQTYFKGRKAVIART